MANPHLLSTKRNATLLTGKKIPIAHKATQRQQRLFLSTVFVLFVICLYLIDLSYSQLQQGMERIPEMLSQMMTISFDPFAELLKELVGSVIVAFLSVVFGVVISLFLSFLVASNIAPNRYVAIVLRVVVMIIRTIPSTIWILLCVASVGFGSMAGVLGLIFPTSSYLIKSFSSQIEEAGYDIIEAMQSVGATWWQIVFKGLLPTLFTTFLATTAFRFEINMAESVMLGMVGAGGIGYLLQGYMGFYEFSNLTLGILMVFLTMFLLEVATNRLRMYFKQR